MVPLSTFAFWQVPLDSITLNGKAIPGTSTEIILDTGTTITYLPPSVADAMLAPIGATRLADGSYTVPVANVDMNTRFGFTLGGKVFEMNALDLVNAFTVRLPFMLLLEMQLAKRAQDSSQAEICREN